tara:strand:- start:1704 stop:2018 length:315 start_codon:yes stop_codon:yes gene_type:complete
MNLSSQTGTPTGDSFESYPDHYKLTKGVNVSTSGIATFKLADDTCTAVLEGSIDGTNFVTVKSVARVGSDILEGHTVAIFPFMRCNVTDTGSSGAAIKVDIAYP